MNRVFGCSGERRGQSSPYGLARPPRTRRCSLCGKSPSLEAAATDTESETRRGTKTRYTKTQCGETNEQKLQQKCKSVMKITQITNLLEEGIISLNQKI